MAKVTRPAPVQPPVILELSADEARGLYTILNRSGDLKERGLISAADEAASGAIWRAMYDSGLRVAD